MSTRNVVVSLSLTASTGFLVVGGCEDAAAKAQTAQSQAISQAGSDYGQAMARTDRGAALGTIASSLSQAGDGSPGSGAAAALMEATTLRDIAVIHLNEAAAAEGEARALRSTLQGLVAAATQLNAVAGERATFDTTESKRLIAAARTAAQQALEGATGAVANLEGPIQELTAQNDADRTKVTGLRDQSRALREQAFARGNVEGFELIRQAVASDRRADGIEQQIAGRDIELMDLRSQLATAQTRVEALQMQIRVANEAEAELTKTGTDRTATASDFRGKVAGVKTEFGQTWSLLSSAMSGPMATAYSECEAKLTQALAKCQAAGGDEAAGTLRVRLLQMQGQVNAMKARGLENHAMLLSALAGTGGVLGDAGAFKSDADATNAARTAAADAAKAAYADAASLLEGVGGNSADAARLKTILTEESKG